MKNRAFTIVELAVVMAVVALLIGLLIPALSSVTAASRSARCQFNLKQMAIAAQNYAAIFDAFPIAIHYETTNVPPQHVAWDWVMAGTQVISPGALWNYCDNPGEVMQCPVYEGSSNFGEEYTGYNYNTTFVGGEKQQGWPSIRPGVPPHACNRASRCAMFGDAGRKNLNLSNSYMRAPLREEGMLVPLQAIYAGAQSFRHRGTTNAAFVDGHIGSFDTPCKGNLATPGLLAQMGFPHNGFLSDDNSAYDPR